MKLSKKEVMEFLPHRDPFLFIDSIDSFIYPPDAKIDPAKIETYTNSTVTASFEVKKDMAILSGHFPGNPILPGVVQVEIMAQASIFFLYEHFQKFHQGSKLQVALLSVSEAKFRRPVTPGMILSIQSQIVKIRGQMLSFDCGITGETKAISEAKILASYAIVSKE